MAAGHNVTSSGRSNTEGWNTKLWNTKTNTKPNVNLQSQASYIALYDNPIAPGSISQRLSLGDVDAPKGC